MMFVCTDFNDIEYEPNRPEFGNDGMPGGGMRQIRPGGTTVEQISAQSLRRHMQQSHNVMNDGSQ